MGSERPRTVVLLAPAHDPSALRVQALLDGDCRVVAVDSRASQPGMQLSINAAGLVTGAVQGVDLDDIDAIFVRAIAPRQPRLADVAAGRAVSVGASGWRNGLVEGNARRDLHTTLLLALQQRGAVVVNPARAGSVLEHKPWQLMQAAQVGLAIPSTTMATVSSFGVAHSEVVDKPLRGGGLATLTPSFGDSAYADDQVVARQQRVVGDDVRVFVVGDDVAVVTELQGGPWLDYRGEEGYQSGRLRFTRSDGLNDDVTAQLITLSARLQLPFCAIDLKRRDDGSVVFLEANGSPVFADVDDDHHGVLSKALAKLLTTRR